MDLGKAQGEPGGVEPGQKPLGRRLLVARGAVHLPGAEKPRQEAGLEAPGELRGVQAVVLHGVGVALDHRPLKPGEGAHHLLLELGREA